MNKNKNKNTAAAKKTEPKDTATQLLILQSRIPADQNDQLELLLLARQLPIRKQAEVITSLDKLKNTDKFTKATIDIWRRRILDIYKKTNPEER